MVVGLPAGPGHLVTSPRFSPMPVLGLRLATAALLLGLRACGQTVRLAPDLLPQVRQARLTRASVQVPTGCGVPGLAGGYTPSTADAGQLQQLAQVTGRAALHYRSLGSCRPALTAQLCCSWPCHSGWTPQPPTSRAVWRRTASPSMSSRRASRRACARPRARDYGACPSPVAARTQVVAGTNYQLQFATRLNCSDLAIPLPVTLQAVIFEPLPYTNSPPSVRLPLCIAWHKHSPR